MKAMQVQERRAKRLPSRATQHGPSFLRWAGSKRKSLRILNASYIDATRHYVEPFAGSAALFFDAQPTSATLADLNGNLINALRQVRDNPEDVHARLLAMGRRSSVNYYRARAKFNAGSKFGIDAAVLFIYLNRNCFNGRPRNG
jgi:DNA adenine methylase